MQSTWRTWTEPNGIDTDRRDVVHLGTDALEISNPIAIGVFEARREDLVDHRLLPPCLVWVGG